MPKKVSDMNESTTSALEAYKRGYTPVPIRHKGKAPMGRGWQNTRWTSEEQVIESFEQAVSAGSDGVGLLLGEHSNGLVDVDLDHEAAMVLAPYFLPPTKMMHGRPGSRSSHRWYRVTDPSALPGTRRWKMVDGSVSLELRTTGGQTLIPPSYHPSGEQYEWVREPFGGESGPAVVDAAVLAVQVALTGMGAVLYDAWPEEGGRNDAYLALVGGLLRHGDSVHPFWERNVDALISGLAEATDDADGAERRVSETVENTIRRLQEGKPVGGFPKLAEIIGSPAVDAVISLAKNVEQLGGFDAAGYVEDYHPSKGDAHAELGIVEESEDAELDSLLDEPVNSADEAEDPMLSRVTSWDAVDLGPFISGKIVTEPPSILSRDDGKSLFYVGKVNMLFGPSESAKSWICQWGAIQHMVKGERVVYIDMEDDPAETVKRLMLMGADQDDLRDLFTYIRPEDPIATMQRDRWGKPVSTTESKMAESAFASLLAKVDPTLVIVDGMTAVYSLHGLDTNDSVGTETINKWLKSLTRGGRTGVVIIDHTTKGGGAGSAPIGSQHKTSMVSGSSIRADAIERPVPGHLGKVNLRIYKDRPGQVRAHAISNPGDKEALMAEVTIDSRNGERVEVRVESPAADVIRIPMDEETQRAAERLTRLDAHTAKVLAVLHRHPNDMVTTTEIAEETGLERAAIYDVWRQLKVQGTLEQVGERKGAKYRLTDQGKVEGGVADGGL